MESKPFGQNVRLKEETVCFNTFFTYPDNNYEEDSFDSLDRHITLCNRM